MAQKNRKEMIFMDIKIECKNCDHVATVDVNGLIKSMHDSIDNDSIYAGFLCKKCADELFDED